MAAKAGSSAIKWIVILILLGGLGYGGWVWYERKKTEETKVEFRAAKLTRGDIIQSVSANGALSPLQSVTVGSQVSGQITNITVDFNSPVTEGQVLAQLDAATYWTKLTQSKADLSNARASLTLAEVNYRRAKELYASKLIAQSEYDQAQATLDQARASVEIRQSAVQTAEVDLSRTTIFAPITGIVISRNVDVGQTVAASLNTPTLFVLVNSLSKMEIGALVSEADIGGVEEGQLVNFTVEAFPGRNFAGNIRQVRYAAVTNQNVVNYTIVVSVDNADLKLRPGMTATANIVTAQKQRVLRLPKSALRAKPPETLVLKSSTTNSLSSTGTNAPAVGRPGMPEGMPTPPWAAEGRRPTDEERQKWTASLTPEQQEQMRQMRERMRGQGGGPGGGQGGGGRRGQGGEGGGFGGFGGQTAAARPRVEGPQIQTVYTLVKTNSPDGKPLQLAKAVKVKTGVEDATYVEVLEGLDETDEVIIGVISGETAPATTAPRTGTGMNNPFGGPGGGGGGRRF